MEPIDMTKLEWLEKVERSKTKLHSLIANYHPSNLDERAPNDKIPVSITAPNAERACEVVRSAIRKESHFQNPEAQFNIALAKKDVETLGSLLSAAWFGVPESTACWQIEGFKEAVDLLDDPPDTI
jgi:hypothetical protein